MVDMSNASTAADLDLSTAEGQIELCWRQYDAARADDSTLSSADARLEAQLQTRRYRSARAHARRLEPPRGPKLWWTLGRIVNGRPAGLNPTGEWALG
jgi:hypothetical protein